MIILGFLDASDQYITYLLGIGVQILASHYHQ